jgi:hypothetical protein
MPTDDFKAQLNLAAEANRVLQKEILDLRRKLELAARKLEVAALRDENARLTRTVESGLRMKVADRGGLSIYGLQRFPVTLFKSQWRRIFAAAEDIEAFMAANDARLRSPEDPLPAKVVPMRRRASERRKG